jgi:hypothetical protein
MRTLWHLDPLVFLLLGYLAVLTIAFFWPGNGDGQGGSSTRRPLGRKGPASFGPPWNVPPGRFPQVPGGRQCRAVRELETACGDEYATRFAPAVQRVRVF